MKQIQITLEKIKVWFKSLFGDNEPEVEIHDDHIHSPECGCEALIWDEQEYLETEAKIAKHKPLRKSAGQVKVIPVHFHIIHKGEPEGRGTNISNAQIDSGINVMNEYFSKELGSRGDKNGSRSTLRFMIQNIDDEGNPTNGISRFSGAAASQTYADHGIRNSVKGETQTVVKNWSRQNNQHVYNIWVVSEIDGNNGGSGVNGFAYYPTTSFVDGTVLIYNTVGRRPEGYVFDQIHSFLLKSYTDEGLILPHELGHAFGLRHTFDNYTCLADNPELHPQNIMSYSSENLKTSFEQCQTDRMDLVAEVSRPNLLTSNALSGLNTIVSDAELEIISPQILQCSNLEQLITVKVTNTSDQKIHKIVFQYAIGESLGEYTWYGPISPQSIVGYDIISIAKVPVTSSGPCTVSILSINDNPTDIMAARMILVPTEKPWRVELLRDLISGQISWDITDAISGIKLYESPLYPNFKAGEIDSHTICLPKGKYVFTARDLISGFNTPGAYIRLIDGDENIVLNITEPFTIQHYEFRVGEKSADLNEDGIINILDFSILSSKFGSMEGDINYDVKADLNSDGFINIVDYSIMANQFNNQKKQKN